jgi:peptidoglycan/LPS O-acetylase OafA/YrhL
MAWGLRRRTRSSFRFMGLLPKMDVATPAAMVGTIAPAKENRPRQLDSLTGLRFFAAFFILFAHACDWVAPFQDNGTIQHYGTVTSVYGMPLFFVLSGFVIHYNYGQLFSRTRFRWAALEFFGARFARLYPLFIACFAVGLIVDCTYNWVHPHPWWWAELVVHFVTMTQSWFYLVIFDDRLMMNNAFGLAWSISTEFFFYICYMALVFFLLQLHSLRRTIVAWLIFSIVAVGFFIFMKLHVDHFMQIAKDHIHHFLSREEHWDSSFYRWFFYYSPYCRIFEFILGCLTAQLYLKTRERPISRREERWSHLALGAALVILLVMGVLFVTPNAFPRINDYLQFLALNFLCAIPIAVLIFCVSRYDTRISRLLCMTQLVALGEISYSIYSVHTWTLRIFIRDSVNFSPTAGVDAIARITLGIALTLVVATATYRLIEVRGRTWLRRFFERQNVVWLGLRADNLRSEAPGATSCLAATVSLFLFLGVCLAYQLIR